MIPSGNHIKINLKIIRQEKGYLIKPQAVQPAEVLEISTDIKTGLPFTTGSTIQVIASKAIEHSGETFILIDHVCLFK